MRRSGARLTLSGALGKHKDFDTESETDSAIVSQAGREIKHLKQENQKLKKDLADVRSLYNQLIKENSHERFDERRVILLKSQVIQLERQVLVLNDALSSRGTVLFEVENALKWLADKCRSEMKQIADNISKCIRNEKAYIAMDVRGPQVNVERSDLTLMVETAESARIKLYKQLENTTTEQLALALKFYGDFVHPTKENNVTLFDVASGNLEHLNLKQVSKLEGKLSTLYKELIRLHSLMEEEPKSSTSVLTSGHVTHCVRERLSTQILKSCAIMKDCTDNLLELSLLFPSAPWPALKSPALKKVTSEYVLKSLPIPVRLKQGDTTRCIQALVKAYNYKVYMLSNEIDCLKSELKYHQKVYNLQLKYTESLFQVIREGYSDFEQMGNEVIVKPLQAVLDAYINLNQSASEESLKKFISVFKAHASQLSDVVETLKVKDFEESDGSKTLSEYGDEFFMALEKLVKEQQAKRDMEALKSTDIKSEQEKLDFELREILQEQEHRLQQKLMTSSVSDHSDFSTSMFQESQTKDTSFKEDLTYQADCTVSLKHRNQSPGLTNRSEHDNASSSSSRKSKKSSTNKPLHSKEWVNIIEGEKGFEEQDVDQNILPELSDKELLAHDALKDKETYEYLNPDNSTSEIVDHHRTGDNSQVEQNLGTKQKTKKKLNYIPNTFVPNRTLKLLRSGSLTRINKESCETSATSGESGARPAVAKDTMKSQTVKVCTQITSQRENSAPKMPAKRPAFR